MDLEGRIFATVGRKRSTELLDVSRSGAHFGGLDPVPCPLHGRRVGALGFERHRTKSALCNLLVYGYEGIKKTCCRRPPGIASYLDRIVGPGGQELASTHPKSARRFIENPPSRLATRNPRPCLDSVEGRRIGVFKTLLDAM